MMIRNYIAGIVCSVLVFTLMGCLIKQEIYVSCYGRSLPVLLEATDIKSLFADIAAELCVDTCYDFTTRGYNDKGTTHDCANCNEINHQTVLVTDFADIQTYMPNNSGILMGEIMRASLNNVCCYKIIQAEFAKYFKLSNNGLVVLTRMANEIRKEEYNESEVVVGTYSFLANNKLLIFVRRIDMTTGKISKIVTRELDYSCSEHFIQYTVK